MPLWPFGGLNKPLAGFEQALEAREEMRPALRHGVDDLGVRNRRFLREREFHGGAGRFEFVCNAGWAFGFELGLEVDRPFDHELLRTIDFEDFADIPDAAVGDHEAPIGALFPRGLLPGLGPVPFREFRLRQRVPKFLGRRQGYRRRELPCYSMR